MQVRTIDVPREIPKRSIKQYLYAEAARLEKRFRTDIDESETTVHKHLDAVSAVLQDAAKMISCSIILPTGSKKSGWKRYTMRHFFATYLLEHGRQAGGSRPAGTRRYRLSGTNLLPSAGCLQRGSCRVV